MRVEADHAVFDGNGYAIFYVGDHNQERVVVAVFPPGLWASYTRAAPPAVALAVPDENEPFRRAVRKMAAIHAKIGRPLTKSPSKPIAAEVKVRKTRKPV